MSPAVADASHFSWIEEPLRRLRMDLLRTPDLHGAFEALVLAERTMLLFTLAEAVEQVVEISRQAIAFPADSAALPQLSVEIPAGLELPRKWEVLIREILLEAFRNWRAHGRESVAQRKFAKKDPRPSIRISFKLASSGATLLYEDDGPGPDPQALFKRALQLGLLSESEKLELGRCIEEKKFDTVHQLVFRDGLSTREAADTEAGRGMGLSRLASEARLNQASLRAARSASLGGMALVLDLPCRLLGLQVQELRGEEAVPGRLFGPCLTPGTQGGFRVFWQLPPESASWSRGYFARNDVHWISVEFGGEAQGAAPASPFRGAGLVLDPSARA